MFVRATVPTLAPIPGLQGGRFAIYAKSYFHSLLRHHVHTKKSNTNTERVNTARCIFSEYDVHETLRPKARKEATTTSGKQLF